LGKRLGEGSQIPLVNELHFFSQTLSAGVSAFFVLSGFLLSYPFWLAYFENNSLPSLRLYSLRRAARIIPGYYVSLVFCFLMSLVIFPHVVHPVIRLVAGLTFTNALTWQTMFPAEFNGPLWSVGFEVICYVLLPFAMVGLFNISKKRTTAIALFYWIGVLSVVLIINNFIQQFCQTDTFQKSWDFGLTGGAKAWWPKYNPVGFFGQYIFGVFAAAATLIIENRFKKRSSSLVFDSIALMTTIFLIVLLWETRRQSPFVMSFQSQPYYFPLFPFGIGVLLCTLPYSKFLGKIFDNRFFRFTALLSFGLYIWHDVILEFIGLFWIPQYDQGGIKSLLLWLSISTVALIFSYCIAGLSWIFIEKPILAWPHEKAEYIKVKYLRTRIHEQPYPTTSILVNAKEQVIVGGK
jgi:peptidoglycan/LPS O-acetylase OafA/YrhL